MLLLVDIDEEVEYKVLYVLCSYVFTTKRLGNVRTHIT